MSSCWCTGDGLPSMVDVGDDNLSVISESSDLQRARKMYADLQAMSMESAAGSLEVNMRTLLSWRDNSKHLSCCSECPPGY